MKTFRPKDETDKEVFLGTLKKVIVRSIWDSHLPELSVGYSEGALKIQHWTIDEEGYQCLRSYRVNSQEEFDDSFQKISDYARIVIEVLFDFEDISKKIKYFKTGGIKYFETGGIKYLETEDKKFHNS